MSTSRTYNEKSGLLSAEHKKPIIKQNHKALLFFCNKTSEFQSKLNILNLLIKNLDENPYRPEQSTGYYLENMQFANKLIAKLTLDSNTKDFFKAEIFPIPKGYYKELFEPLNIVFEKLIGRIADHQLFGQYKENCHLLEKLKSFYENNLIALKEKYSSALKDNQKAFDQINDALTTQNSITKKS